MKNVFLRHLQASWGVLSFEIEFGALRSIDFQGQIGQFAAWGIGWTPSEKRGLGGQAVVPACGAVTDAKIGNWGLAGFLFLGQD